MLLYAHMTIYGVCGRFIISEGGCLYDILRWF